MIAVQVNGRPIPAHVIVEGGRVLLPMRTVFQALGATVHYDARGRIIIARTGRHLIVLPLSAPDAVVDGRTIRLAERARVVAGTTYVPLRFAAQALGARVSYRAADRLVAIVTTPQASGNTSGDIVYGPAGAQNAVQYRLYASGGEGGAYRAGDWMRFVLVAPPGGTAVVQLCNLGIQAVMSSDGRGSTHYYADIQAPPGYWIPFCPVTATYVSWSGISTLVPVPLAVALYTRTSAYGGYYGYYGSPYYGDYNYGYGSYYGAPYYGQPYYPQNNGSYSSGAYGNNGHPPTPPPRALLPNEPRAAAPTAPPRNSVHPIRVVPQPPQDNAPPQYHRVAPPQPVSVPRPVHVPHPIRYVPPPRSHQAPPRPQPHPRPHSSP